MYLADPAGHLLDSVNAPLLTENVSYGRKTDGSILFNFFSQPTPDASNNTSTPLSGILEIPNFSLPAGFYPDTISLYLDHSVAGVDIHYTLDGSEPSINSPVYTAPLKLRNRTSDPTIFANIPTNPGTDLSKPNFDTSKANSRGWLPPYGNVYKINVVRARAFKAGKAESATITRSYIVDSLVNNRFSLPVISINTDRGNLFDADTGLYVYGNVRTDDPLFEGNYSYSGNGWQRPIYIEYFQTDGSLAMSRYASAELNGNGGRHAPQKSFRITKTTPQIDQAFNVKLFDDKELSLYEKFLIRNSGHRPDCMPRDDLADKICDGLNMEVPNFRNVIVFINGEYWGIQSVKERFDHDYFQHNFNIKKEDLVLLEYKGHTSEGVPNDSIPYISMINFVSSNDMSIAANYDYVKTQMDIENYITFLVSEMYLANGDYPNNNTRYWRKRTAQYEPDAGYGLDGRWRWVLYDLDGGFGGTCPGVNSGFNAIKRQTSTSPEYVNYTILVRALLTNPDFKRDLLNRYADLLNSTFSPKTVSAKIIADKAVLDPEMTEHVNRWRYPSSSPDITTRLTETPSLTQWNTIMNGLLGFAKARPANDRKRLMDYFALTDTFKITLNVSNELAGEIKINTLNVNAKLDGVNNPVYPWSGSYFKDVPIALTAIAHPGYRFDHWSGSIASTDKKIIINLTSNSTYIAVFVPDASFTYSHLLYVNEIISTNKNVNKDPYNENDDWIEIYNPTDNALDLQGYYLTDDITNKTKYKFPYGTKETIIEPKGFKIIWADHQPGQGNLHTPFRMKSTGERIILFAPDSTSLIDSLSFGILGDDISYGRLPNGSANLVKFTQPTPEASNHADRIYSPPIVINNFVAYPNPVTANTVYFTKYVNVSVYNVCGQVVMQEENVNQLDVTTLAHGIYYLKTTDGETAKVVKLK